ncbi:MAG: hypothetical protein JWR38_5975 [Mucilaginibacter sp.]|nr:hypothetical protein [Mucilaginibacter sp.]
MQHDAVFQLEFCSKGAGREAGRGSKIPSHYLPLLLYISMNSYRCIYLPAKGSLSTRIGCVSKVRLTRAHTARTTLLINV